MGADFKPDYTTASFAFSWLEIYDAAVEQTGTITLNDGGYEYRSGGGALESVSVGTARTFNLYDGGDYYAPADDYEGYEIFFLGAADTTISEMGFSFTIGSTAAVTGQTPVIRKTADQLYAPYVALTVDGNGMATGLTWYLVDPQNPTAPLVRDVANGIDPARVGRVRVSLQNGNDHYNVNQNVSFSGTETLSTPNTITFDDPVPVDQIRLVRVNVESAATGTNSTCYYGWEFMVNGGDSASGFLLMTHSSRTYIENWKTNHGYNDAAPRFANIYGEILNMSSKEEGTIDIDFNNLTHVWYEHAVTLERVGEGEFGPGPDTLPISNLYGGNYYSLSNGDGAEAYFEKDGETGISESAFTFTVGSLTQSGVMSKIRSTEGQIANGCIPYIVFDEAEVAAGKITKATVRFVESLTSTAAVNRDAYKRNISGLNQLQLRTKDNSRYRYYTDAFVEVGEPLEFAFKFFDNNAEYFVPEELSQVRVYFNYGDSFATNSETEYGWRFDIVGARPNAPAEVEVPRASQEELRDVETALGGGVAASLAESANQYTRYDAFRNAIQDIDGMGDFDYAHTMSALFVKQAVVKSGDVVVLGSGTKMEFSAGGRGINGETALHQSTSFADLRTHYSVLKSFPGGGTIDLLERYHDELFDFTPAEGDTPAAVTFKATIAIVDNVAPNDADERINSVYGVKLDGGILFIFDGAKDGTASDPISLTQKTDNGGSSSSGCATAGMILPFALFAAVGLLKKRG